MAQEDGSADGIVKNGSRCIWCGKPLIGTKQRKFCGGICKTNYYAYEHEQKFNATLSPEEFIKRELDKPLQGVIVDEVTFPYIVDGRNAFVLSLKSREAYVLGLKYNDIIDVTLRILKRVGMAKAGVIDQVSFPCVVGSPYVVKLTMRSKEAKMLGLQYRDILTATVNVMSRRGEYENADT